MASTHKIVDYDAVLDAKFGKEGTPERARAEEAAYSFYSGQILQDARKEAKMTQSELAERTQTTKSYISKIEFTETVSEFHPRHPIFGHVGGFFVGLFAILWLGMTKIIVK